MAVSITSPTPSPTDANQLEVMSTSNVATARITNKKRARANTSDTTTEMPATKRASKPSSTFPFLKLPREIRDMIYALVPSRDTEPLLITNINRKIPALWSVNSQIRTEAMDVHLRQPIFMGLRPAFLDDPQMEWSMIMPETALVHARKVRVRASYDLFAQGEFADELLDMENIRGIEPYYWCNSAKRKIVSLPGSFMFGDPLFELELVEERKCLVVRTISQLMQYQEVLLREAIVEWVVGQPCGKSFTGEDLMGIVKVIDKVGGELLLPDMWQSVHVCDMSPHPPFGMAPWVLEATKETTQMVEQEETSIALGGQRKVVVCRLRSGYNASERIDRRKGKTTVSYDHTIMTLSVRNLGAVEDSELKQKVEAVL